MSHATTSCSFIVASLEPGTGRSQVATPTPRTPKAIPSVSLAVTGAQSGNTYSDADSFTVTVKGAPNTAVYVQQTAGAVQGNKYPMGTTNSSGIWSTSGSWAPQYDNTYTQVWYVGNTAAAPTLNFT